MRNKNRARSTAVSSGSSPRNVVAAPVTSASAGLLIAVELGAGWPEAASDDITSRRRVLCQVEGETPAVFAERAASAFDSLFGRGIALASFVLACNERTDTAAQDARRKLAGVALGSMAKQQAGRACFATTSRSSGRLRQAISALAQGLHDEWRTAGLEVTVDTGDRAPATAVPTFTFTARVA